MGCRITDKKANSLDAVSEKNLPAFNFEIQTDEYNTEYNKWHNNKDNKYSYPVTDSQRERSYVKGKGYIQNGIQLAEGNALKRCYSLIGLACIFSLLVNIGLSHFLHRQYHYQYELLSPYIYNISSLGIDSHVRGIFISLNIFKSLVPLLIFTFVLKMPAKVMFPVKINSHRTSVFLIGFSAVAYLIVKIPHQIILDNFSVVNISFTPTEINPNHSLLFAEIVFSSILIELFFRGAVLQLLRQFGDCFALIFTTIFSTFMLQSFLSWDLSLVTNFAAGFAVIMTGSLLSGITIRVILSVENVLVTHFLPFSTKGQVLLLLGAILIASLLFVLFVSKKAPCRIKKACTSVSNEEKHLMFFTSLPMITCIMLITIYNITILNIVILRCV